MIPTQLLRVALDQVLLPIFVVDERYLPRGVFALFVSVVCVLKIDVFVFVDHLIHTVGVAVAVAVVRVGISYLPVTVLDGTRNSLP